MTQRSSQLRRLPLIAALALVGLTACGDTEPRASDPTEMVAPAADGDLRAPTPIEYTSAGSAGGANGTPAAAPVAESGETVAAGDSADGRVASDMIYAPTYVADFVVADGLVLPDNSTGWLYAGAGRGSAEMAAQLATVFGVSGEVTRVDDWQPGGWQIGPSDGSGDSFFLSDDAQLSWNYSPRWSDQDWGGSVGCAMPAYDPDSDAPVETFEPCVVDTTPPPVGVPTAAEAEARARELLAALGIDPSALVFDTYADEWGAYVSATEHVDGLAEGASAGRNWNVGFGAEGALTWAGGVAATPEQVGPYALVDLTTAVERLEQYQNGVAWPVDLAVTSELGIGVTAPAVDTPSVDPATVDAAPPATAPGDVEILPMPIDEMPGGTYPEPEPITVTLVDVQADVWWVWDADGNVWVVPAYRFIGDDGGWYTVPAVADEYLIQADAPIATDVPEPAPVTDPSATTEPEVSVPDTTPLEGPTFDESIGKSIDDFSADAEASGYSVRVTEIDGVSQPVTMDYRTDRVNVAVTTEGDGTQVVVAVVNIG